ncbi:MAG: PE domain-containing protein, partial [Mycobacteriaceae bacterium]|nr:PE domain-containing protein [Mycobacteriaceae bacterium]
MVDLKPDELTNAATRLGQTAATVRNPPSVAVQGAGADSISTWAAATFNRAGAQMANALIGAGNEMDRAGVAMLQAVYDYLTGDVDIAGRFPGAAAAERPSSPPSPATETALRDVPAAPEAGDGSDLTDPEQAATLLNSGDNGASAQDFADQWQRAYDTLAADFATMESVSGQVRTAWAPIGSGVSTNLTQSAYWLRDRTQTVGSLASAARGYVDAHKTAVRDHPTAQEVRTAKDDVVNTQGDAVAHQAAVDKLATLTTTSSTVLQTYRGTMELNAAAKMTEPAAAPDLVADSATPGGADTSGQDTSGQNGSDADTADAADSETTAEDGTDPATETAADTETGAGTDDSGVTSDNGLGSQLSSALQSLPNSSSLSSPSTAGTTDTGGGSTGGSAMPGLSGLSPTLGAAQKQALDEADPDADDDSVDPDEAFPFGGGDAGIPAGVPA